MPVDWRKEPIPPQEIPRTTPTDRTLAEVVNARPQWLLHPVSQTRAEEMGLAGEPECGACAEYIYCGTAFGTHKDDCPNKGPELVMSNCPQTVDPEDFSWIGKTIERKLAGHCTQEPSGCSPWGDVPCTCPCPKCLPVEATP